MMVENQRFLLLFLEDFVSTILYGSHSCQIMFDSSGVSAAGVEDVCHRSETGCLF
jgi:hypothetical protein